MTTSRSDSRASSSSTWRCEAFGSARMVCSVVTIGMRSSRRSGSRWEPALPPKIPYSCCTESTSTSFTFRKSAARRYDARSPSAISNRTRGG